MVKKYDKHELEDLYINQNMTSYQLAEKYKISNRSMANILSKYRIKKGKKQDNSKLEKIVEENKKLKIELDSIKKQISIPNNLKYQPVKIDFPETELKFLVFGDCHIGHNEYRPDIMDKMVEDAKRNSCIFAINCGDTIEGMSGRDGQIYELNDIGASEQLKHFKSEFEKFNKLDKDFKIYTIEATNSHGGWFGGKGNMGLNIGEELEKNSSNYKFIGYDEQDLILDNGLKLRLRHPGSGTAYALSYKLQKYIEGISGGQKPNMVFEGHFHKSIYMFYRNIHAYDVGTLQNQSIFMKKIGTPAHLGYWIVDCKLNKTKDTGKLVERVTNTFVPFFE